MKYFAQLVAELDATTKTNEKIAALVRYLQSAPPEDAALAVHLLNGNRPKRAVATAKLHAFAARAAGLAPWLFAESYDAVGDLAETIALVVQANAVAPQVQANQVAPTNAREVAGNIAHASLAQWLQITIPELARLAQLAALPTADALPTIPEDALYLAISNHWFSLDYYECLVFNKLITGGFRVGVSAGLVQRALGQVAGLDAKIIATRLAGKWQPTAENYLKLVAAGAGEKDISQPYPFFLAHPIAGEPESLGECHHWQAEWKWDGIRCQLVKRAGQVFLWSRGEELITPQFPELAAAASTLPDVVLDGEILVQLENSIGTFADLQRRLGRKAPAKKILSELPCIFMAYDLLELAQQDLRAEPLSARRAALHRTIHGIPNNTVLQVSDIVRAPSWATLRQARNESRARGAEGLMLKRLDAPYGQGRTVGTKGPDWIKWKIDPLTLDCVLMYAQRGHGKRANLYTDYTFGVWNAVRSEEPRLLVTFAKAYSGLSDAEIAEVDAFIRKNTLEKFGPVRTVTPQLVFELAFEGIQKSNRHKSGVAVRFPRMLRLRRDKKAEEADSLESVMALLSAAHSN